MTERIPIDKYCEKKISTLPPTYEGLINYIDISSVDNIEKEIVSYQTISSKEAPSRAKQLLKRGDILVSTVRPNLNAVALIESETENLMVGSTGYCVLRCKENADARYLFHFCQSPYFVDDMSSQATGASYPAVSNSIVRSSLIPCYSVEEQRKIADKMDALCGLIKLRKKQLSKLDELVKSRFIELFGNSNYPCEPLDNNVIEMFIGPFGSSLKNEFFVDEEDGFCMVYEQKHAIQKTMNVPTRYVLKSKYEELKRFTVVGGDIIVSCRGTIGEIFIIPEDAPMGIMHPSIMKIRLKNEKYNQSFFVFALKQYMDEHSAEAKGSGVKMAVSATVLGQSDFVMPPLEVQNQFSAFVEQVDKSKYYNDNYLQSLDKYYFTRGERVWKNIYHTL